VQDVGCARDVASVYDGQERFDLFEIHLRCSMLKPDSIITIFYFIGSFIQIYDFSIDTKTEIP
jgi:hypothetical protein